MSDHEPHAADRARLQMAGSNGNSASPSALEAKAKAFHEYLIGHCHHCQGQPRLRGDRLVVDHAKDCARSA